VEIIQALHASDVKALLYIISSVSYFIVPEPLFIRVEPSFFACLFPRFKACAQIEKFARF
jgi:hypothetical protein